MKKKLFLMFLKCGKVTRNFYEHQNYFLKNSLCRSYKKGYITSDASANKSSFEVLAVTLHRESRIFLKLYFLSFFS